MKKEIFKYLVVLFAAFAIVGYRSGNARAADYSGLMINLYVSDERILIYAGMDRGIFVGQRFNVFRNGRNIGSIVIVDVRTTSSIAKTVTKTFDFKDMDLLSPADGTTVAPAWRTPSDNSDGTVKISDPSGMTRKTPSVESSDSSSVTTQEAIEELSKKKKIEGTESSAPAAASSSKSSGDKKTAAKEDKKDTKTETKKEEDKEEKKTSTKSSSRGSSRSSSRGSSSKSDDSAATESEEKPADKEEKTSAKKSSRSRGSSSSASNSDDSKSDDKDAKKADAKPKAPAKPLDPRDYAYSTNLGYSGLWTIPTTDVIGKNRSAFSYYHSWRAQSASNTTVYPGIKTVTSGYGLDLRASEYSFTYGVARNVEISLSKINISAAMTVNGVTGYGNSDGHSIGIKYNHGMRRHFLEPTTAKKWSYAVGGHLTDMEGDDSTFIYGLASVPTKQFDFHAGLYFRNYNGMVGKRWGTMAGVEVPVSPHTLLIGEGDLFQSDYTFNVALRYIYRKRNSFLLGIADITEDRIKEAGFSFVY